MGARFEPAGTLRFHPTRSGRWLWSLEHIGQNPPQGGLFATSVF